MQTEHYANRSLYEQRLTISVSVKLHTYRADRRWPKAAELRCCVEVEVDVLGSRP